MRLNRKASKFRYIKRVHERERRGRQKEKREKVKKKAKIKRQRQRKSEYIRKIEKMST
jgi:hypothetical protein